MYSGFCQKMIYVFIFLCGFLVGGKCLQVLEFSQLLEKVVFPSE